MLVCIWAVVKWEGVFALRVMQRKGFFCTNLTERSGGEGWMVQALQF